MAKLFSIAATAGALAVVWVAASAGSGNTTVASLKSIARDTVPTDRAYRLSSAEMRSSCILTRGGKVSRGTYALWVDATCDVLMPGISRVRYWRERADGTVEFTGEGGDALAAFAEGDGVDYESFRPRSPLLSLKAKG